MDLASEGSTDASGWRTSMTNSFDPAEETKSFNSDVVDMGALPLP